MSESNEKQKQATGAGASFHGFLKQNDPLKGSFQSFKAVASYYSTLTDKELLENDPSINCYAVTLSRFIAEEIRHNTIEIISGSVPDFIINQWVRKIQRTGLWQYCDNDSELCVIYIKQMIQIMKSACILAEYDGKLLLTKKYSIKNLYAKLLHSFWNKTSWKSIFPSSEAEASHLQMYRREMGQLLQQYSRRDLNSLYRDYSYLTGHKSTNILFSISFIDFYLMTWLKHFDIINYIQSPLFSPVTISITEPGRNILQNLTRSL